MATIVFVILQCVNKIETMYEKPRVNVKVEPRSTFTFTSDLPYIVSNLFMHVEPVKVYVRTHVKITRQWKSTFRPVARKGYGSIAHEAKPNGLLTRGP